MLERRVIKEQDVVLAFQHAGLPLRPFTQSGSVRQFTASSGKLVPAVVVSVFPTEQAAKHSETSMAINGKRVRAIGMRNVRIFVAAGATAQLRRQITHVLALLRRVR